MSDTCKCCGAEEHPIRRARCEIRSFVKWMESNDIGVVITTRTIDDYLKTLEFTCPWCEESEETCTCFA